MYPMRKRPKRYTKSCQGPGCARRFKTANPHAKYHAARCRWAMWNKLNPRAKVQP